VKENIDRLGLAVNVLCLVIIGFIFYPSADSDDTLAVDEPIHLVSKNTDSDHIEKGQAEQVEETPVLQEFGFNLADFSSTKGIIKRNQFLADILEPYGVDGAMMHQLAINAKDVFDVRKLNYGKPYTILSENSDWDDQAKYFIYEPSDYFYVVYELEDSMKVEKVDREIVTEEQEASGVIYSSLYETLLKNELDPELTFKLADIFAWTVDFHRIEKGDKFKVVYEQEYIDCEPVGINDITAAWFEHRNQPFYAIPFEQDNLLDFYDIDGASLRKQFLKAPLRYSRISSRYSKKRFHPVQKRNKPHLGTDYAAPTGTPIHAVGDGVISAASYGKYNGRYVKIRHNSTYTTQYLHMSKIAKGIKSGAYVKQGDVIGYVGSTGLATGPHLCFRFWKNGAQVDPFKQKLPPSKPVKESLMESYVELMAPIKKRLDAIEVDGMPETTLAGQSSSTSESEILLP